jgi:hypothetical protein
MDDVSRYRFLASAIAGRRVAVDLASGDAALTCSDGQSILLPAATAHDDAWAQVVAQAALIGAGSLQPQWMRALVGRPDAARRYAYLEVLRATGRFADRLPVAFLQLPEISRDPAPTRNAAESLEWALGRRVLPPPPAYFGCVRPLMTLRKSVSDEGLAALTRRQQAGEFSKADMPEFDDDDATEESKLLKLFQNPLTGRNPLADLLNKLLGAGSSPGKRENADSGGGAEMPVGRVERALRRGIHAVRASLPAGVAEVEARGGSSALRYPE